MARDGVEGLLRYTVQARMTTRPVRAYRDRPARRETEVSFAIDVCRDEARIEEKKREMGWQVYGTNALALALPPVVWAYRGQYRIEDDWSRLKGRSLGLTPVYLQDEERIQGLVCLLSLALRVLTLVEWVVRERLCQERARLQGIYAGQPGRKTDRPSAELLLGVLKTISISVVEVNGRIHALLSPLTEVQNASWNSGIYHPTCTKTSHADSPNLPEIRANRRLEAKSTRMPLHSVRIRTDSHPRAMIPYDSRIAGSPSIRYSRSRSDSSQAQTGPEALSTASGFLAIIRLHARHTRISSDSAPDRIAPRRHSAGG